MDSLSKTDSERDRGYSNDENRDYDSRRYSYDRRFSDDRRDYEDRRYRDDYSDSRDYSVQSDRYDEDHRPIVRGGRGSGRRRDDEPGLYNTGYRPPSYAPSWDSYGKCRMHL